MSRRYGCREGILSWWEGTREEVGVGKDLTEVGWSAELDSGGALRKL